MQFILSLASSFQYDVWNRGLKQTYAQSDENLLRELYIRPQEKNWDYREIKFPRLKNLYAASRNLGAIGG